MLDFSVTPLVIFSRLWIRTPTPNLSILMKKTSSEHYCLIFSNIYENIDKIESGFLPTSGKIPLTSGSSDWPN